MMLLLSLVISVATGTALVWFCWPAKNKPTDFLLTKLCLGTGAGIGVSSLFFFIWLGMGGYRLGTVSLMAGEILFLAFLIGIIAYDARTRPADAAPRAPAVVMTNRLLGPALALAAGIGFAGAILTFFFKASLEPHGGWDAWAIWNMKARFLFRGPAAWSTLFSGNELRWANLDYPLLLPGYIARCWRYARLDTLTAPIATAFLFTFSTAGLLYASVARLRCREYGALAALALLATPFFVLHGASQYADIPFGFYLCATIAVFAFIDSGDADPNRCLALAGFLSGCAVWMKNEGALFFLALIVARSLVSAGTAGRAAWLRQIRGFFAGALVPLLLFCWFKIFLAPANKDIVIHSPAEFFAKLGDLGRYLIILRHAGEVFWHFGFGVIGTIPALALFLFLAGVTPDKATFRRAGTSLLTVIMMCVGYFFVYVLTAQDLAWHIGTTIDRLAIQLWPTTIFSFFMLANTPASGQPTGTLPAGKKRR